MFEEKESMWKKKGFYVSVCTAMICLLAIGTVYYRMNRQTEENSLWASRDENAVSASNNPKDMTGDGTEDGSKKQDQTAEQDSVEIEVDDDTAAVGKSLDESIKAGDSSTAEPKDQSAGGDQKQEEKAAKTDQKAKKKSEDSTKAKETVARQLAFNEEKGLLWPVKGDIIMKYDLSGTTYFQTLAQYRSNPALVISAKEGTKVKSAAEGEVLSVEKNDETGMTVTMNIGNDYTLVYGQLKDVTVKKGDMVKAGDAIASIAKPTQYYSEEGTNLYFQVKEKKETVDPLLLLQ